MFIISNPRGDSSDLPPTQAARSRRLAPSIFWTTAVVLGVFAVRPVGVSALEYDLAAAMPGDSLTREVTAELGRPDPKPSATPAPAVVAATPAPVVPKATPAVAAPESTPAALAAATPASVAPKPIPAAPVAAATPVPVVPKATPAIAVAAATPAPVAAPATPSISVTKSRRERSDAKAVVYHRHHHRHAVAVREAVAQSQPTAPAPEPPRRNPVVSFVYWWNGFVIKTFHTKIGTVMLGTVGAKT